MKTIATALFSLVIVLCHAQTDQEKLTATLKQFHQALVNMDTLFINRQTDAALIYGHSNGWLETKTEMIAHLQTGFMTYHSFKEDSINIAMSDRIGSARFTADINVTRDGFNNSYHLKVLEVWVKKGKYWILFARQAIRA